MILNEYVRAIRRYWRSVVAVALLGALVGATYSLVQSTRYEATAQAFVSTGSATSIQDLTQGSVFTEQIAASYATVADSSAVLDPVIRTLKLPYSQRQLSKNVQATAIVGTSIIQIQVVDHSSLRAVQIADAISARLGDAVDQLSPTVRGENSGVKISQIQKASGTVTLVAPRPELYIPISFVVGVLLGILLAVARLVFDNRIRDTDDLPPSDLIPMLGNIPLDRETAAHPLVVPPAGGSHRAEAFRSLRATLQFFAPAAASRVFAITSSVPQEGKSTTASNLALALSESGERVLLIDADLRRPSIARYFGVEGGVGLSDVLIARVPFDDAVQHWGDHELTLLPAGEVPPNPSELLQSAKFVTLLQQAAQKFDVVLIDTPPLLGLSDAAIVARRATGAILLAAAGKVRVRQFRESLEALDRVQAKTLGVVLTMAPATRGAGYSYDYGPRTSRLREGLSIPIVTNSNTTDHGAD